MSRTTIFLAIAALTALGACGGGSSDPVEQTRTICQARVDSESGCSDECVAAGAATSTACGDELSALMASSEWDTFFGCAGACSSARTCTSSAGTTNLIDCECGAACIRARSADFQDLYVALALCVDEAIAPACY